MAAIVGWETLRGLARFRAEKGLALSFYVGLDPSVTPTAAEADTRFNSLLHDAERKAAAARGELTHEQREALKGDLERVRRYFDDEFDRDGAHGLAVFSAGLDNFWTALPLAGAAAGSTRSPTSARRCRGATTRAAGRRRATSGTSRRRWPIISAESPTSSTGAGGALRVHLSSSSRPRRRGPSSTTCWHRRRARRSPDGRLRRRTRPRRTWSRRRCRSSRTGSLVASRS